MTEQIRQEAINWQIRLQQSPNHPWLKWRFSQWLKRDPHHRKAWAEVERLWDLSGLLAPSHPMPEVHQPRRWPQAVAACLILCAGVLAFTLKPHANTSELQADGSRIWPRPGSELKVEMNGTERRVELVRGAAYFDVQRESRPFVVNSAGVEVRVIGTAFTVEHDDNGVSVQVERGLVQVNGIPLQAHQQVKVSLPLHQASAVTAHQGLVAPWRDNQLLARNATIADLSEQLDAVYSGLIVIGSDELRGKRVSGRFDLDKPEQSLREMVRPFGAEVHKYWPGLLVLSLAEKK